jgi:hypothetical protein
MDSKKAQGISLNFIVIAIIAALVLVIIIAFTVGGLGTSLSKIFQADETSTEDSDLDLAKAKCEQLCNGAKQINAPENWQSKDYCGKSFTFDGESTKCWEAPISVDCSTSGQDIFDTTWKCDETKCGECSEISCSAKADADKLTCEAITNHNACVAKTYIDITVTPNVETAICNWKQ